MSGPAFTNFHEDAIQTNSARIEKMNEVLGKKFDELNATVGKIHSIVTNGLRDTVRETKEEVRETREDVKATNAKIAEMADPEKRAASCPLTKSRRERRKSWDWILTLLVAISSILLNFGTFYVLIKTGVL